MEIRCICGEEPIWNDDLDGPLGEDHVISTWSCPNCRAFIEVHTGYHDEADDE